MKNIEIIRRIIPLLLTVLLAPQAYGQYFGKNKVNYETFDFKIYRTPHFQIYHYLDNEQKIKDLAQLAERWYDRHQAVMFDTFQTPSPIIFYNNHADFQQTTVISSLIGVGTGGVTEGYRNRVVMPVKKSNAETNHVLGHEMVHVFQYHMFKNADSLDLRSIGSIPLWMIEGLAEYMSIGNSDPHTAMWMREALMRDDIPTIEEMTRRPSEYFPYRYGHAFWSFITSRWGDGAIKPLLLGTAISGPRRAMDSILGFDADTLSIMWKAQMEQTHLPHLENRKDRRVGEKLFGTRKAINIAPAISPDGRYVIFLADRDVITIDFYLADVQQEKVIKRLTREIRDTHIDNYSFLESMGTWSPDSRKYALSLFSKGRKRLIIFGVNQRSPVRTVDLEGLQYFDNPAWSPDGRSIVVAGLQDGQSDLFLYDLESDSLTRLTDDYYSDQHPAWSPDGKKITFISDRGAATDTGRITFGKYRLCEYDLERGGSEVMRILPGADIYNPQYAPDGEGIYFISPANGVKNLYHYAPEADELHRLTDLKTGISSISALSPALSVARETELLTYVLYEEKGYSIYKAAPEDFTWEQVNPYVTDLSAASLVPAEAETLPTVVERNLERYPLADASEFTRRKYKPKFGLETITSAGVGVGISQSGAAAGGGIGVLFSDMLKRNQLFGVARVNGRLIDVAGQVTYLRQKNRINWGASLSHFPYLSVRSFIQEDVIDSVRVTALTHVEQRIFEERVGVFGVYPVSKKLRFEAGLSAAYYSFRIDSTNRYFSYPSGIYLGETREQLPAPEPKSIFRGYVAHVGDDAYFGLTSPLRGYRYRVELSRSQGWINYWGITADYRRYFFFKPFGLAFRAMHNGRYGKDAGALYPMYLGYPYYVRGYQYNKLYQDRCPGGDCLDVNQISGTKMVVAGAELRLPFTGPRRLALIKFRYLYTDLVGFFDGGLAWSEFGNIGFSWDPAGSEQIPVFSAGAAIRINLFGALIIEPYYAFPFQRDTGGTGEFGFTLLGVGW